MLPDYLALSAPSDTAISGPFLEMVNSARAYAYAERAGIPWLLDCGHCPGAHPVATYDTPSTGSVAPWYVGGDSGQFLGVIGLDVQGADDSTRQVRVTPTLTTGGVIGPVYYGPRTLVVSGIAIASSEAGLQAGIRWMQYSFAENSSDPCVAYGLVYYDCCGAPPTHNPEPNYRRQFRKARISEGPSFLRIYREMNSGVGALVEFEMSIVTADPFEYYPGGGTLLEVPAEASAV